MSDRPFRLAVASGKGGTGKTTAAVAITLAHPDAQILDCDVEAPNAHLFLDVEIQRTADVSVVVPVVRPELCDRCADLPVARCREACEFGALALLPDRVMIFPEICHGCGACVELCPRRALAEERRAIGVVESGTASGHPFVQGRLNVGEPRAVDVIRAVRDRTRPRGLAVIDVAPGVACSAVEALRNVNAVLLVTEPTPFGLHDLDLAADLCAKLDLPAGVLLNRADIGDDRVETYCAARGLPVLLRIPHDRAVAEAGARGVPLTAVRPDLIEPFRRVVLELRGRAEEGVVAA